MSSVRDMRPVPAWMPPESAVTSVACLMLGAIGDLLVATPAFAALKQRYPKAHLTVIVRSEFADLVRHNPHVDRILPFSGTSPGHKAAFLVGLRFRRWDLWVDLHVPTYNTVTTNAQVFRRNALMMRAARSRYRLGFDVPALSHALTHAVLTPPTSVMQTENLVDTMLRLTAGAEGCRPRKELRPGPEAGAWAGAFFADRGLEPGQPIALFFGAKQEADVWPHENVRAFCQTVCRAHSDCRFILVGGPHEAEAAAELRAEAGGLFDTQIVDATNQTTLLQTAALLERCRAMVTTDSGPMHMADAVGLPMVALFSSKNYLPIWLPLVQPHEILNVPVACGPCLSSTCHQDRQCMRSITPEAVLDALCRLLARLEPHA